VVPAAVDLGGVQEGHAQADRFADQLLRGRVVPFGGRVGPAHPHQPEPDRADLDALEITCAHYRLSSAVIGAFCLGVYPGHEGNPVVRPPSMTMSWPLT